MSTPNEQPNEPSPIPIPLPISKPILVPEDLTIDNYATPEGAKKLQQFLTDTALASRAMRAIALVPDAQRDFRAKQKKLSLPYYREGFARELMRAALDPMIEDGLARTFHKNDFRQWSISTLSQKIRQAFEYAVDYLDHEDFRYKILKESVEISTAEKNQVVIKFINKEEPLIARIYKTQSSFQDVHNALNDIIEHGDFNSKFKIPPDDSFLPFFLDAKEMEVLKELASKFPFISIIVTPEEVQVIKILKEGGTV